jgi:DNA-binding response OmpR family regulator
MKILVVEDDKLTGKILCAKLSRLGHEVLSAENGKEGWLTYCRERPRIVITDWLMPVMDGLELSRKIRTERRIRYTYVIMLTALEGRENFLQGMFAGADDFLTKPVDLDTLMARLRVADRVLQLQSAARDLEGLLSICAYCKRIRDDQNQWQPAEQYLGHRTDSSFARTLCPECTAKRKNGNGSMS